VVCTCVDGRDERCEGGGDWPVGSGSPLKGAPVFRQWRADAADARAPTGGGRGSVERGAGRTWAGPEKRGVGRAWMNSSI
jgi:hypothetical protein